MNRNGLKIGEFSRLCRVTVRALSVRTPVAAMGKDFDIIKFKQIPEAAEAVCMKVYGPYGRLNENIREILEWIEANGYTITYPPRYSYVDGIWNQEDPEKWLTIIQVPVTR